MAKVTLNSTRRYPFTNVAPYGNLSVQVFPLKTNASGGALDADSSAPLAIGDVVDLGPLQEGLRLDDAQIIVTTGMSTSASPVTGSLGFAYEDGVNDAEVPQNAAYFGSGLALSIVGRVRAAGSTLVTLPKPARLILTTAGMANAKASDVKVLVFGEQVGAR